MRPILAVLLLSLLPVSVMAQSAPDSVDFRLDAHQWEHRLLFVFVPAEATDRLAAQEEAFSGTDVGFRDRDLLLITLTGAAAGTVRDAPGAEARPLTDAAVERLYDRFTVPADSFRVILVGKDGTEKRRNAEPVSVRSIFDTIDAMPMRQQELRQRDSPNGG
jgi:hypothetical protein